MKTTFNLVQDLMLAMNARERSLHSPDDKLQENLCAWMGAMVAAEQHVCSGPERALLDKIVAAMDMQAKRESGEFHILPEAAEQIWNSAKLAAQAYVIDQSARQFGYQGLANLGGKSLSPIGRTPQRVVVDADTQPSLSPVFQPLPGIRGTDWVSVDVIKNLEGVASVKPTATIIMVTDGKPLEDVDQGQPNGLCEEIFPGREHKTAPCALVPPSLPSPEGEGYLKQRAEALANAMRRFGVDLKHGQALTVVAQLEGRKSFQALKTALPQYSPCFCPHCGAAGTLKLVDSVYCEQGEYDGKSYEAEGEGSQYQCGRCKGQFNDWTGLAVADSGSETWGGGQNGFSQDNPDFPNAYQGYEIVAFTTAEELQGNSGVVYDRRRDVEEAKAVARERLTKDTCFAVRVRDSRTGEDIKF